MTDIYAIFIAGAAGLLSWALIGRTRAALLRHRLLDHPNERSSHTEATPRGAGVAVLLVLLPVWLALSFVPPAADGVDWMARWLIPAGAIAVAAISFIDDMRGLPQLARLAVQVGAVAVAAPLLPGFVFQGLVGPTLDIVLAGLLWLWFVNLFNFMDGIDGIAGVEAISIGLGLYLIGAVVAPIGAEQGQSLALAAAMAGFLVWNWHPARIFLGDVGSIPLGFLLGWLLLNLAASGLWQAALILPLYYLADASLTLLRRLLRGAAIWQAHREHCYQIAVQRGRRHSTVAGAVALANTFLVALALMTAILAHAAIVGWLMLAAAILVVAALMVWMVYGGRQPAAEVP